MNVLDALDLFEEERQVILMTKRKKETPNLCARQQACKLGGWEAWAPAQRKVWGTELWVFHQTDQILVFNDYLFLVNICRYISGEKVTIFCPIEIIPLVIHVFSKLDLNFGRFHIISAKSFSYWNLVLVRFHTRKILAEFFSNLDLSFS